MCAQVLKLTALEPPLPPNASAGPPPVPHTAQAQVVTHDDMATEETVPVRSFMPIFLSDFVIQVQLRDGKKQNLVSKPLKEARIAMGLVLQEIFKDLPYQRIRNHHLSFDAFQHMLESQLNLKLDLDKDEIGWVYQSSQPNRGPQFYSITDESTFQNACGVLRNETSKQEAKAAAIVLHIFSPKWEESPFQRPRRAQAMHPHSLTGVAATPNATLSGHDIIDIDDLYNDDTARPKSPIPGATNSPLMPNPLPPSSEPPAPNSANVIADVLKQMTLDAGNQSTQVLDSAKIDEYMRNQAVDLSEQKDGESDEAYAKRLQEGNERVAALNIAQ
jgi:hypothetical protein